jgi:hypothetical protein
MLKFDLIFKGHLLFVPTPRNNVTPEGFDNDKSKNNSHPNCRKNVGRVMN